MIDIDIQGLDELEHIIKQNDVDIEYFKAVVYNTSSLAQVFEYGSIPGIDPWHSADDMTTQISDIETGAQRIVSRSGFAMLRGNEKKCLKHFIDLCNKIDLTKPIREQIVDAANKTIVLWESLAVKDSPDGNGVIAGAWEHKKAY